MSCSCRTSCRNSSVLIWGRPSSKISHCGDLVAANVQFADDRDFEAHRKHDTEARKVTDEKYCGSFELCQTKFAVFFGSCEMRTWRC